MDWITLPYILGGLIAWWRRPDSRFGPLMVVAGFATFLSTLAWANAAVPFTIGIAFDFLPPVLFLHVFLAFPSGRLEWWFERGLVAAAYLAAVGVSLVRLMLGGFGPNNLLELTTAPGAAMELGRAQLFTISALALAGIGVLAARRSLASAGDCGRPNSATSRRRISGERPTSAASSAYDFENAAGSGRKRPRFS